MDGGQSGRCASFPAHLDQCPGGLFRLPAGAARGDPAGFGHGLVCRRRRSEPSDFRNDPPHPSRRLDPARHLLVRHRHQRQDLHHLDRRHRALRDQFVRRGPHDEPHADPDGQDIRCHGLANLQADLRSIGPADGLRGASDCPCPVLDQPGCRRAAGRGQGSRLPHHDGEEARSARHGPAGHDHDRTDRRCDRHHHQLF